MQDTSKRIRVLHIITCLDQGGAEMMLCKLLSAYDRSAFEMSALSLANLGVLADRIRKANVNVEAAGLPNPMGVATIVSAVARMKPHIVQTWMYHADLIGGVLSRLAGCSRVVWNLRHTTHEEGKTKRTTIWTTDACARLSRHLPAEIVCCSEATYRVHADLGYDARKMRVIPNGFDLTEFAPDAKARIDIRRELGLAEDTPLVGIPARFDPQKDHPTFIRAASLFLRRWPSANFLMFGEGMDGKNETLTQWIRDAGIQDNCHLLGYRRDMNRVLASLDIAVSCSAYGEAFPNVLGEAMACGVPCTVTDVGDSRLIVGDTGRVIRIGDAEALAQSWEDILRARHSGHAPSLAARRRVMDNFNLAGVVEQYQSLYRQLANA
jgi:glycosyltransferase involved in cell wall biosynthesis